MNERINDDLETGVSSPIRPLPLTSLRTARQRQQAESQAKIESDFSVSVATPLAMALTRLKHYQDKLAKVDSLDDFLAELGDAPTVYSGEDIRLRLQGRGAEIKVCKDEVDFYTKAVNRLKNDEE
jgi:hypothetical protein